MSRLKVFRRKSAEESGSSSSISDLMSGLMIIFLFIAVSFMSQVVDENTTIKKQQETVENIVNTYENTKGNIYDNLYEEFKDDMDKWHMEIDEDGTIRFTEPEVFFDKGESTLKKQFKNILDSFFPRYIKVIHNEHKDNIKEIRIEGHTSSEWEENSKKMDSYFGNMDLSQGRTRKVLSYIMNLQDIKPYKDWLMSTITANGMSYSKRIYDENGKEDFEKSRRVEFKVITNAEETINSIIENYEN